jgi:isoleucyl-tRNA synthetase
MNFNNVENEIISYWKEQNVTDQIKESRKYSPEWHFLDGPPFVNGTPHHGHLLVSSIKDTMARYMIQKGYKITYQIGFDCHGLPLEQEAEKTVGKVSPNDSVESLKTFNNQCRSIISNCSEVWYETLGRLGRQFDKSQTYKTCDLKYMESIWWAFKKLWDDGLIYQSKKVMAYSPKCETPLSNFEAGSNYQDRTDISIYVKFKLVDSDEQLLIWTTTPWSLFANQGICVNGEFDYQLVELSTPTSIEKVWVCKESVDKLFNDPKYSYTILKTIKGIELLGLKYNPIFPIDNYYNYQVYVDSYVQNTSGTGIVHLAPLFGEDDMRVLKLSNTLLPEYLIDSQVKFNISYIVNNVDIKGTFVMDTTTDIVIHLKNTKHVFKSEKIKHSYPYCWRTDYPLIYLATDAWFMNVQKIIPELIENNKLINWFPSCIGTERFANWIKDSPDWCLSRNRVWGTPIPIWINEHGETMCIGSVKELEDLTGQLFPDIHLDSLGSIEFTIQGKGTFKRTFGVLDCWFESGMAGLARYGYPECTTKSYPVDFISESVDQTRGWFYTLNVLSTALNHTPAFKNVIVSGLILAEDGKKMSKRLGNYTSPDLIIEKYGADILRLYMIGSPASKAESFCFKDVDLVDITRKILPYYNAHLFLKECTSNKELINIESTNQLDLWIKMKLIETSQLIYKHMEKLEIYSIPNHLYRFIDVLCNTFIKLSRDRMKGLVSETAFIESNTTLYYVLNNFNKLLVPFMPHLAEYFCMMINNNDKYNSLHLETINIKSILDYKLDMNLLNGFYSVNELLETVRNLRQQNNKPIFYPLDKIELFTDSPSIIEYQPVICKELNIKNLIINSTESLTKTYRPNKGLLCKFFKKDSSKYISLIEKGDISWEGCIHNYYTFEYNIINIENMVGVKFNYNNSCNNISQAVLYLSINTSKENDVEAEINNIRREINSLRKEMNLKLSNKIEILFEKNTFWDEIKPELIKLLSTRLGVDITFTDKLEEYKTIKTFIGTEININIKLLV